MHERFKARAAFAGYMALLVMFESDYSFMIFNIFLAFAALELSFLLPLFAIRKKSEIPLSAAFYLVFILLSPNVFYVVTDLIHLNIFDFHYLQGMSRREWWNFTVLLCGVLLAVFYYALMLNQISGLFRNGKVRIAVLIGFMALGSVGIYMGRFLRFHSIHLFTEPFSIFARLLDAINLDFALFVGWMTLLQFLTYWLFLDRRRCTHD